MKCSVVVNVLGVYSKDVIQFSKTLKSVCPSAELIHTALSTPKCKQNVRHKILRHITLQMAPMIRPMY